MSFSIMLAGCVGQLAPKQTFELMDDGAIERLTKIKTISPSSNTKLSNLGEFEGYSCKNKMWDPDPNEVYAVKQLKMSAANLGATAISEPVCRPEGTSLSTNCWSSIVCKAFGYK